MSEVILLVVFVAFVFLVYNYLQKNGFIPSSTARGPQSEFARFGTFFSHTHNQADKYTTTDQVTEALRKSGLESSNLIIGIDYTASNDSQGYKTFGGKSLHHITLDQYNPYQKVIKMLGETLEKFDEDRMIPVFGFGDVLTSDTDVFPFLPDPNQPRYCHGVDEVLQTYTRITPGIQLSGPTNFAPLIYKAIETCFNENGRSAYHILVIIADGQVCNEKETQDAIVEASKYPISIIMVGVGDGPWENMADYDDGLPKRLFDNFQFVDFSGISLKSRNSYRNLEVSFTVAALMEIPDQYQAIKKLNLIGRTRDELKERRI